MFAAALISFIALALSACFGASAAAHVQDTDIDDVQVATTASVFEAISVLSQAPCGETDGEGDTPEAACNRFALGALIQFAVAQDYAAAHDLSVTDADLNETADLFAQNFGEGALESALEAQGVTHEDFLAVLRGSMLQQEVAKAIVTEGVSEDDLRVAYEAELASHVIVQVDHILVATAEEAQEVYAKVTAPGFSREDFQALAAKISKDPSAAQNEGSLASTPVIQFVPEFQAAVLAMENGEISEPVQTEFGFHVIHMVDKEVTPFEEVRDDLVASQAGPAFAEHARDLLADEQIDVNPRYGRLDPQTLTVVRITSTDPAAPASPTGPVNVAPPEG